MNREESEAAIAAQASQCEQVADVFETTTAAPRSQLAAVDADERGRRQATLLFADVSGFTAVAETLDAEEVSDVSSEVWERLDVVVAKHGGAQGVATPPTAGLDLDLVSAPRQTARVVADAGNPTATNDPRRRASRLHPPTHRSNDGEGEGDGGGDDR